MANVERASYRAVLAPDAAAADVERAVAGVAVAAQELVDRGEVLTAGLFGYRDQLFLYLEFIYEGARPDADGIAAWPDRAGWMAGLLVPFPKLGGTAGWAYMYPVFWFDEPASVEGFARTQAPDARCGRIARLYPDKLMSYVCHHQAIAREGTFVGDRYQFISLQDDVLFSYFETPRDREQVNIRRTSAPSEEIGAWLAVDPASHFDHFPEAHGDDFLIIDTLVSVGRTAAS